MAKFNFEIKLIKVQQLLRSIAIHQPRHRNIRIQTTFYKRPLRICKDNCVEPKIDNNTCMSISLLFVYSTY